MVETLIPTNAAIAYAIFFIVGIILTIFLIYTGEKTQKQTTKQTEKFDNITILKISISLILLVYIFRLVMMFITGVVSEFYTASIIGLCTGLIPIIVFLYVKHVKKENKQV